MEGQLWKKSWKRKKSHEKQNHGEKVMGKKLWKRKISGKKLWPKITAKK